MNEWIRVTDHKPEPYVRVWTVRYFIRNRKARLITIVAPGYIDNTGKWYIKERRVAIEPTYWLCLPPIPSADITIEGLI